MTKSQISVSNMSDSKPTTDRIGFSTGALERGNYLAALNWLNNEHIRSVELSALRIEELEPLVSYIDKIPRKKYHYVSFHAPSAFPKEEEQHVVSLLRKVSDRGWNIIVHPDVIYTPSLWRQFGEHLLIENMDRRKPIGRTAKELSDLFMLLPAASLCLDVAHARQMDTTLTLLSQIIGAFLGRIREIHISELDSECRHQPMSYSAVDDYRKLAGRFRPDVPVIIESMLDGDRAGIRMGEFKLALDAMEQNGRKKAAKAKPTK